MLLALLTNVALGQVELYEPFPGLKFDKPVDLTHDGTASLYVVEQAGRIYKIDQGKSTLFLDIRSQVKSGGEMGLLGLAFHPRFRQNGLFYVDYTAADPLRTVVACFRAQGGKGVASSEHKILEVKQPYPNHNGGQVRFGPDGYLYVGMGDGGAAGDPHNNGQNRKTLLGSILRIEVDADSYQIPADNPFVGTAFRPEIYAYGLRNPWRFSFDRKNGELWTGDVGQDKYEEIDIIKSGGNYGWNWKEGNSQFKKGEVPAGLKTPIHTYGRREGQSVTGGFVYRGKDIPALQGKYLYADFVNGRVWSLTRSGTNELLLDSDTNPSSFGEDASGEVYLVNHGGTIHRFRAK
jgi:glucose/arabinose dehydrogenase